MRKKIFGSFAVIILITLIITVALFCLARAKGIARPEVSSLEDEIAWEKEHNLWGNYDTYKHEEYTVKGYNDYELHLSLIKNPKPTDKYVIISHGFKSNRYGGVKYLDPYINMGFNCIIYDMRGHGENEAATVSLGQFESMDLEKIIEDTYIRYGNIRLGLHGESMGAATSLMVLGRTQNVAFVVADCGFSNLYNLINEAYNNANMGFITPLINTAMKLKFGYDMKKTSPKDALLNNEVPICFIHGEDDVFILPSHSKTNKAATKGYSEIHIIKGAAHAQSREIMGEANYRGIITEFLNNIDFK